MNKFSENMLSGNQLQIDNFKALTRMTYHLHSEFRGMKMECEMQLASMLLQSLASRIEKRETRRYQ